MSAFIRYAEISGSGATLGLAFANDQTFAPANVTGISLGFVQLVTVNAVGGTFDLTIGAQTITVPYGVFPSNTDGTSGTDTLQARLETIVGVGNVTVVGWNPYRITFATEQPAITIDTTNLLASRAADPATAGVTSQTQVPIASKRGNWVGGNGAYTTPGSGDSTTEARWTLSGLAVGNYRILATWPGGAGYTLDAKFRVYDGSTYVGCMDVEQLVASGQDVVYADAYQGIGTFYTATGTLNVVVTDESSGKLYVNALVFQPADPSVTLRVLPQTTPGWLWSDYQHWGAAGGSDSWLGTASRCVRADGWWEIPLRGLRLGTYQVEFNYHADPGNSVATPVRVWADYAASNLTFDQTSPPLDGTHNDGTNAVPFASVGTYEITRGGGFTFRVSGAGTAFSSISAFAVTRVSLLGLSTTVSATVATPGSPSIRVNGGPAIPIANVLWATNGTLPYATCFLGTTVDPGDVVTLSTPAYAFVTRSGSIGQITDMLVLNRAGGTILPDFDPGSTRTMKLGWNVFTWTYLDSAMVFANLMKGCTSMGYGPGATRNALGELTTGTAETFYFHIGFPNPINPRGYKGLPTGTYTVKWESAGSVAIGGDASPAGSATWDGTEWTRLFTVTTPPDRDQVYLQISMTGPATNVRVYPPGCATDGSDVFHPEFIRMLTGAKALRSMVWINPTNNIINYEDLPSADTVSYQDVVGWQEEYTITKFEPYPDLENFIAPGYVPVLATLDRPHRYVSGSLGVWIGNGGDFIKVDVVGGIPNPNVFQGYPISIYYNPATMASNQMVVPVGGGGVVDGVQLNPGRCIFYNKTGGPLDLYVRLCNEVGCDAWVNTTQTMTDDCLTQMFTLVANDLAPGKKCVVELSNEPWNDGFSFYHWFAQVGNSISGGAEPADGYAYISGRHHDLARAAFTAAGRDAEDVVSFFNTNIYASGFCASFLDYCQANEIRVDAIGGSPYYNVGPHMVPGFENLYNSLTTGQVCDIAEYQNKFLDIHTGPVAIHRALLDSHGYTSAKIYAYEMGPATAALGGTDENQAYHTQGLHQNPRFLNILLDYFRQLDAAGYDVCCLYAIYGIYISEGTANGTKMYCGYNGWDQLAGKGDGSDGKADNRIDPWNTGAHVSVVGQAVLEWNAVPVAAEPEHVTIRARWRHPVFRTR